MEKILEYAECWFGRFRDAFSACSLMMVQGDVTALTVNHLWTAAQTGFISAVAVTWIIIFTPRLRDNSYMLAGATGVCVAIADLAMHPSHYQGVSTEAIMTGIGAGLLTYAFTRTKPKR